MIKFQYLEDLASGKIKKYKNTDIVQESGPVTSFYFKGHVICIANHYTSEFMLMSRAEAENDINAINRIEAYNKYFRRKGYRKVLCFSDILD